MPGQYYQFALNINTSSALMLTDTWLPGSGRKLPGMRASIRCGSSPVPGNAKTTREMRPRGRADITLKSFLDSKVRFLDGITFETAYAKLSLVYKSFKNDKKRNNFLKKNNFFEKIKF